MKKNTINIAIDMLQMENRLNNKAGINIHTIVDGKAKEQLAIDLSVSSPMDFKELWNKIGERIEQSLVDNPEYYPFGS